MKIKNILSGYDTGYVNVEAEIEDEKQKYWYIWVSRSMDYETIMIFPESKFSMIMQMMHAESDFDLIYDHLELHAAEIYETENGAQSDPKMKDSRFYEMICLTRDAVDRYIEECETLYV